MKLLACEQVHWHDCVIQSVLVLPEASEIELRVEYPMDWEANQFELATIRLLNAFGYKEYEEPFAGAPTILRATSEPQAGGHHLLRIETNAGYREVFCSAISLELTAES
ncbi:hypothetical protein ACFFGH_32600 [Lysobacter korlensis]|uniref:Uncharacterized protein n=1 Tax=Lysobacter korlensis TaxID=553636 RepID=A0ABV6S036_9GAMM